MSTKWENFFVDQTGKKVVSTKQEISLIGLNLSTKREDTNEIYSCFYSVYEMRLCLSTRNVHLFSFVIRRNEKDVEVSICENWWVNHCSLTNLYISVMVIVIAAFLLTRESHNLQCRIVISTSKIFYFFLFSDEIDWILFC